MQDGVFVIKGHINDTLAAVVIKQLLDFSNRNPEDVITLYISSEGGTINAGVAIYDVVRFVSNPVSTIAVGKVAGIATLILVAGTQGRRYAYKDASISLGVFMARKDTAYIPPEIDGVIRKIYGIIAKHTKTWVEQIEEMLDSEIELDAKMAVQKGFIDKVI